MGLDCFGLLDATGYDVAGMYGALNVLGCVASYGICLDAGRGDIVDKRGIAYHVPALDNRSADDFLVEAAIPHRDPEAAIGNLGRIGFVVDLDALCVQVG